MGHRLNSLASLPPLPGTICLYFNLKRAATFTPRILFCRMLYYHEVWMFWGWLNHFDNVWKVFCWIFTSRSLPGTICLYFNLKRAATFTPRILFCRMLYYHEVWMFWGWLSHFDNVWKVFCWIFTSRITVVSRRLVVRCDMFYFNAVL